jgi:hypothetical protein
MISPRPTEGYGVRSPLGNDFGVRVGQEGP